jgi:hypothetical protein
MLHPYLEEDPFGNIVVCNPDGTELASFGGDTPFQDAIQWASEQGLELHSNKNPGELQDNQRLYFRRRPRFLRMNRFNPVPQPSNDPPNVKRVIVPNYDEMDYESLFPDDNEYNEDIELAPRGVDAEG